MLKQELYEGTYSNTPTEFAFLYLKRIVWKHVRKINILKYWENRNSRLHDYYLWVRPVCLQIKTIVIFLAVVGCTGDKFIFNFNVNIQKPRKTTGIGDSAFSFIFADIYSRAKLFICIFIHEYQRQRIG